MQAALETAVLGLACMVASQAGCVEDEYELPPITWEGELVRFGADEPDAVCGDTLAWMDRRAVALAEVFAGAGAEVSEVEYYWLSQSWEEQGWCSFTDAGCSRNNVIRSQMVPHQHELVHALRPNSLPPVFEEGLAELYGDFGRVNVPAPRERLLDMLEAGAPSSKEDYGRASHFVSFLVERHGLETLLAMADYADYRADWSATQKAFSSAYGFSLEEALVEYEDYPECSPLTWVNLDIACAEEPVVIDPPVTLGDVRLRQELSCGAPGVYGPTYDTVFSETTIEVVNNVDAGLHVRMLGDEHPKARVILAGCGGCGEATKVWLGEGAPEQFVYLPSGRYVLRMIRPLDAPGELGVSFGFYE